MHFDKAEEIFGGLEKQLSDGREYLCGNEITIADLGGAMELEQFQLAGGVPAKFPLLEAWRKRVLEGYPECQKVLEKFHDFVK